MKSNHPSVNATPAIELLRHALESPSVFTPEALVDAVRTERRLESTPVPPVCILEFDGDLTDWLVQTNRTQPWPSWACFHTRMESFEVDGQLIGLIARTIGGPYAVLVAEQLAASGARVVLGLTSAGRVSPGLPIPSVVVVSSAIRDEGTSFHYVPYGQEVAGDARLANELLSELASVGLPVISGPVWSTDAPYRETQEQLNRHSAGGILAVEMQAASLFALGAARRVICGVVAHVTNGAGHYESEQFEKGSQENGFRLLQAIARAGIKRLREG